METERNENTQKRELDSKLDQFEAELERLRIDYELYFTGLHPRPPDELHTKLKRFERRLLNAPFKTASSKFRLRMLSQRFQTYATYWERINKQREAGTYKRDVFKANIQSRQREERKRKSSSTGVAEDGIKQLFNGYKKAVKANGGNVEKLDFQAFKKNVIQRTKDLKQNKGAKKVGYSVVVKNGAVSLKISGK